MNMNKDFQNGAVPAQHPDYRAEIAAIVRSGLTPRRMRDQILDYHENDIAAAMELLRKDERSRLYSVLDVETLADVLSYSEQLQEYLGELSIRKRIEVLSRLELPEVTEYRRQLEKPERREKAAVNIRDTAVYAALFLICVLTVLKLISSHICFAAVLLIVLVYNRRVLLRVDYFLLLTFVCFFVFVGNVSSVEAVRRAVSAVLAGRELAVSALASQVISNVPAAVMLAPFTENAKELLLGVNIGGLGTPVASLASLISYKQYCACENPDRGAFFKIFFAVNFALLAVLLAAAYLFFI